MSGIDKGFLFAILTEVLRGNKRSTLNLLEVKRMFSIITAKIIN